jgi:hypothetical protein
VVPTIVIGPLAIALHEVSVKVVALARQRGWNITAKAQRRPSGGNDGRSVGRHCGPPAFALINLLFCAHATSRRAVVCSPRAKARKPHFTGIALRYPCAMQQGSHFGWRCDA